MYALLNNIFCWYISFTSLKISDNIWRYIWLYGIFVRHFDSNYFLYKPKQFIDYFYTYAAGSAPAYAAVWLATAAACNDKPAVLTGRWPGCPGCAAWIPPKAPVCAFLIPASPAAARFYNLFKIIDRCKILDNYYIIPAYYPSISRIISYLQPWICHSRRSSVVSGCICYGSSLKLR